MWKKAIALLLALSTIFALTACGSMPNDGRGQSFLSEKTPTLSEYLNGKDPVIMYGANQIDKNANVGSIYVFENGKVLLAPFNALSPRGKRHHGRRHGGRRTFLLHRK